jgi:uracil phosphoribosyltransferase
MLEPALGSIETAEVGFISTERVDNESAPSRGFLLHSMPEDLSGCLVFILDPLLSTGPRLDGIAESLKSQGATLIVVLSLMRPDDQHEQVDGVQLVSAGESPTRLRDVERAVRIAQQSPQG